MALMPKRVKFRKNQRGRVKGNASRGNTVTFGDFGLQALEAAGSARKPLRPVASRPLTGYAAKGVSISGCSHINP